MPLPSRVSFFPSHFAVVLFAGIALCAMAEPPAPLAPFLEEHCLDCHDAETKKGGLDLTALLWKLDDAKAFAEWAKVHDRVRDGEMPPKKKAQPGAEEAQHFLHDLAEPLVAADRARSAAEGRSTWRRLNRYEYENTLRDLFDAPWLQIKDKLPEDGVAHRFNKVGDALDVSHVQMARYLSAADYAMREVMAKQVAKPESKVERFYTRDHPSWVRKMIFSVFNQRPERATFPLLGTEAQVWVLAGEEPPGVGAADPETREKEAFGVVASAYEPIEVKWDRFEAPSAGRYKLRVSAYSFWAGASPGEKWWIPDRTVASPGRRDEPVVLYSERKPRMLRRLGSFDVTPEPSVQELDTFLLAGETIRPDAARLFRSRPPAWQNPLAERDGQPGVAYRWLEVEGPLHVQWPPAGHRLLFGDLPLRDGSGGVEVVPAEPKADAERLLRAFVARAYRRPAVEEDVQRFLGVIDQALASGNPFADAMIAGYSAVLCSPSFVCLEEKPGPLDNAALAARLAYFLWNSAPDDELRAVAESGALHDPDTLRAQTDRLLASPRARRFVDAFLDYWLDLRKAEATSPDAALYPDYYLDDLLVDSATQETQLFFAELLRGDLPARNVVASDWTFANERLAQHYGLPPVPGVALQRVSLPPESPRGGLLTQASVLKVTANGTTTSPVVRGAWVMERILGCPPPPPPPSVAAVEPDIRGATTIREQLAAHRSLESCAGCHAKIDPAGFALESFDVLGGWRDRYRALGEGDGIRPVGFGKNGQPFAFHLAQPIDAAGELPGGGGAFADIRELKARLLENERGIARNLAQQLAVYATGAPVRFGDRPEIEAILDRASSREYGVRSLVHELVQSPLFQSK